MDNQSILKSLQALEASLKDINSAKEEVIIVTKSVNGLADVITKYKNSLESISTSVSDVLKDCKDFNSEILKEWQSNIVEIQKETKKLMEAVDHHSIDIANEQKKIIKEFGTELRDKIKDELKPLTLHINELESQVSTLKKQVDRIINTDINASFKYVVDKIKETESQIDATINKSIVEFNVLNKSLQVELQNTITDLDSKITSLNEITTTSTNQTLSSLNQTKNEILEAIKIRSKFDKKIVIFGLSIILLIIIDIIMNFNI